MTWFAHRLLAEHARDHGDEPAVLDRGVITSWAELDARASAIAASLAEAGIASGERVALVVRGSIDDIAAILGILRADAVAAPVPGGLTTRETTSALDVLAPALVLREAAIASGGGLSTGGRLDVVDRDPEAPAVVVLTSGTTGRPRGVVLSSRAMAASAESWLAALPPVTGWAMPLGLGHVAGLGILWRAIRDRVPVEILPPGDPEALDAALRRAASSLRRERPAISHVSLVAIQLARLLDLAGDPPPATLRAVLLGGGPIPPALVTRALRAGWPVVPTYGLSETASGATALATDDARDHPGSAGAPLPGVRLSVEGADVDGVGEIVVEAAARFSGYLGDPGGPAAAAEPVRTGDLGRLDADGRLFVLDRRVDRIVRGGENIAPAEVEVILLEHPAIADAAVVGRPDATFGHVPVAAIVLRNGLPDPGDEALAAHVRAELAGFKVPAAFVRLDALPRTNGGKLRREAVRALLAGEAAGELARPGGDAIGWRVTGSGFTPVLLFHGVLSTAAQLGRLAAALAAPGDVTVHALDRRGSGSGRLGSPRPLDVSTHVADVVAYLDARGIGRASAVGVSYGGVLALELAARHPDRVTAVVAYEPPYGPVGDERTRDGFGRLATAVEQAYTTGGAPAAARTFLGGVAGDAAWDRLPPRTRRSLEGEGDGALADAGLAGLDPEGLRGISCPVHVLTGSASDPFYSPIADAVAGRIPGARRDTLDGCTHPSPITQPGIVAAAVRACMELPA